MKKWCFLIWVLFFVLTIGEKSACSNTSTAETGTTSNPVAQKERSNSATLSGILGLLLNGEAGSDAAGATMITASLDDTVSVSQTIDPINGGNITATAGDGTRFSLTIPPGALPGRGTITLTPVSGITDLPLSGGLTAAVDIQPNGLHLTEAATLTITPAAGVPVPYSIAFGYQDNEFYLYPVTAIDSSSITLKLMHFSGYGSGTGTASDTSAQQGHQTSSSENNYQQKQSEIMTEVARRAWENGSGTADYTQEELDQLTQLYTDWYNDSIKPDLTAAQTNEDKLESSIKEFFTWWAQIKLQGFEAEFDNEYWEGRGLIANGLQNAIDKDYTKCKDNHDASQVPVILGWDAFARHLGLWSDSEPTFDKVRKCATFRLDFLSQITWSTGYYTASSTVNSQVTLNYDESMLEFTGSDTLFYPDFTFEYTDSSPEADCQITSTDHPDGTLGAPHVFMLLNQNKDHSFSDITMMLEPSVLTEAVNMVCPDSGGSTPITLSDTPYWNTGFYMVRSLAGDVDQTFGYVFRNWTVLGGETYATRALSGTWSEGGIDITESGRLKLMHTPQ